MNKIYVIFYIYVEPILKKEEREVNKTNRGSLERKFEKEIRETKRRDGGNLEGIH